MFQSFADAAPAGTDVLGVLGALAGSVFGPFVTGIDRYVSMTLLLVVVVSMLPIVLEVFGPRRAHRRGGEVR
ncbi:hypothetical protein ACFVVU_11150 [Kitasatospora sp. NPDC057965]|uniref:hypothetical protein n=1 Tax=Kitasatospora sp. NPDC057965 TaxID=3346291 RepID=UPI0036DD5896